MVLDNGNSCSPTFSWRGWACLYALGSGKMLLAIKKWHSSLHEQKRVATDPLILQSSEHV